MGKVRANVEENMRESESKYKTERKVIKVLKELEKLRYMIRFGSCGFELKKVKVDMNEN